jgi:integrase
VFESRIAHWLGRLIDKGCRDCGISLLTNDPKEVQPFNPTEIKAILYGFKISQYYGTYHNYVFAIFNTAARPGELAALIWSDVADDFSSIKVRASFSRGIRRNKTKTVRSHLVFCKVIS